MIAIRHCTLPIRRLDPALEGLRIAHLSDLHLRRWNRVLERAQSILSEHEYDLLAVTGDFSTLPSRWAKASTWCWKFFSPIRPRLGIYAVLGNHDSPRLGQQDLPFRLLRDESVEINHDGGAVNLAGLEQHVDSRGDLVQTLAGVNESLPTILLTHYPSTIHQLTAGQVDLMLAGHTHGGQIRLPWIGCVWPNDRIPRSMAAGLHCVNGTYMHVSAGIGVSPPIWARFLCPPELTIITLQRVGRASQQENRILSGSGRQQETTATPTIV